MQTPTEGYNRFIREAQTRAEAGDDFAKMALAAIVLAQHGWSPDDPPDGGETANVLDFNECRLRLAA